MRGMDERHKIKDINEKIKRNQQFVLIGIPEN